MGKRRTTSPLLVEPYLRRFIRVGHRSGRGLVTLSVSEARAVLAQLEHAIALAELNGPADPAAVDEGSR